MTGIRILDLNIWNYNEPWTERRDLIVDLIRRTTPDMVALQEIRYHEERTEPRHQADQLLAGLTGYTCVWQPAHYWPPEPGNPADDFPSVGGKRWEGLAILSRHPVVDHAIARLSRDADDPRDSFQRLVLGAQVRTPDGPFWLFDTHFPLSERARNRVVIEALHFLTRTAGGQPFAFTGDLNTSPEDLPIRFLTGQAEIDGCRGNLVDAWAACHPDEPGNTFSAWDPCQRIDYLFVPRTVEIASISVVATVPSQEILSPSDHCGLLTTLGIGNGD
jgi:endonuclease/exonuclease/phosphatase family metal-dependent hydrolase